MSAMLLMGLILLGGAAAFAGLLVTQNSAGGPDYGVSLFGFDVGTMNTVQAFLAGVALCLVFCLGVALAVGSVLRAHRRRAHLDAERREALRIRAERDEMAARLGIPVTREYGPGDEEETAPLAPSIFPWANPW
jgi:hypothetical protein